MEPERHTNPNPPLYFHLLALLEENGGALSLNSEEALAYWITVLQRHASESEFGTNSDPITEAPKLMVGDVSETPEVLMEVDLLKYDPRNLLDESWSPIELHA